MTITQEMKDSFQAAMSYGWDIFYSLREKNCTCAHVKQSINLFEKAQIDWIDHKGVSGTLQDLYDLVLETAETYGFIVSGKFIN